MDIKKYSFLKSYLKQYSFFFQSYLKDHKCFAFVRKIKTRGGTRLQIRTGSWEKWIFFKNSYFFDYCADQVSEITRANSKNYFKLTINQFDKDGLRNKKCPSLNFIT